MILSLLKSPNGLGPKCYCQYENGGYAKNDIICQNEQGNVTTMSCEIGEGCTGTRDEATAIHNPRQLCEKGIINLSFTSDVQQTIRFLKYTFHIFTYYILGCGNTTFEITELLSTGTKLTSPNYPSIHPNNEACSNIVRVNKGQRIRLTFVNFHLEGSEIGW